MNASEINEIINGKFFTQDDLLLTSEDKGKENNVVHQILNELKSNVRSLLSELNIIKLDFALLKGRLPEYQQLYDQVRIQNAKFERVLEDVKEQTEDNDQLHETAKITNMISVFSIATVAISFVLALIF